MKKHLQFNDITALGLGWRAARRKAEKERRVEREKEQSSSSLLCIFIKENITSFSLVLFFFFVLWVSFFFCLTHLHFFSFLPLCPLSIFAFFFHGQWLISFSSPLCPLIHLVWPFSFTLEEAVYPTMYLFSPCCTPSAIAHSQQHCQGD